MSDTYGAGEEELTSDEHALLGTGSWARDGKVAVPSQSRAFDTCHAIYRKQMVSGHAVGIGPGISCSTKEGAAGNTILNGTAALLRKAEEDRRKHGSDRDFRAVSAISTQNQNTRMSAAQIADFEAAGAFGRARL